MKKPSETAAATASFTASALTGDMQTIEAGKGVNVGEMFRKNIEGTKVHVFS